LVEDGRRSGYFGTMDEQDLGARNERNGRARTEYLVASGQVGNVCKVIPCAGYKYREIKVLASK